MAHKNDENKQIRNSEYKFTVVIAILAIGTCIAIALGGQGSIDDSAQAVVYISIALAFIFLALVHDGGKK